MNYKDINFKTEILRPADTADNALYTVPADKQAKVSLFAYNEHSGALDATVSIKRASDAAATIIQLDEIAIGATEILAATDKTLLSLSAGDILYVKAETADKITFTANIDEYTK